MNADVLAVIVNAVICGAIAVQCACRARFMDRSTPWHYRHSYTLLGTSALSAVFAWPWLEPWLHLVLLGAMANVLWLNSRYWPLRRKGGV